jgi:hypothetical protein
MMGDSIVRKRLGGLTDPAAAAALGWE